MFYYPEGSQSQLNRSRNGISTSLSSIRTMPSSISPALDCGAYASRLTSTTLPPSLTSSTPSRAPSPGLQISQLLHQTASLLSVNAQLRREIEHSRQNVRVGSGKKLANPDSYKTVMCQAWLESKLCAFGENCRFAHGEAELRPIRSVPCQINKYKTKLCDKYTTTGLCPYGDRCLFIHPDHGTNAYIRPDKLVEVSRRHALADMQFLASMDASRVVPPGSVGQLPRQQTLPALAPPQHVLHPPTILSPPPLPPTTFTLHSNGTMAASTDRSDTFCATTNSSVDDTTRTQLRPHPSWPLEPSTFFREKTDEFRTASPTETATITNGKGTWDERSTPARSSCGYVSCGSTPGSSPFSTVSSSSLHLNLTDDDHDFDLFSLTVGFDHIAEHLTRTLELW